MMSSRPLDPLEVYKMNKTRRGLALIFNQQRFADENEFPYRAGSNVDCSNLKMSLKHLGFEVKAFTDLNKEQVNTKLDAAAEADHSDADCFLLVFLSHGEDDHVYASDDKLIIKEITDKFRGKNCRSLVGKPKIFIWQACRGEKNDDPVTPCAADEVVETRALYTLPAGADFIMCYSVAEGYCSYRNSDEGSWYIQDLCELLQMYGESLEFTQLLTLVNAKVSKRNGHLFEDENIIEAKQVPCFASMLTKKLYFHPKM